MGREEEMLLEPVATERYVWQAEGRDVRVALDLGVVDRIQRDVMSAFGSTPRRGVEIGGILLGQVEEDGTVSIRDFERVDCSHEFGPAYTLNEQESARFVAAVSERQQIGDSGTHAVGYFRSHIREGLGVSEEDGKLFDGLFPDPKNVILLIKPYATRAGRAGFFFREDGSLHRESSYREFAFRREDLSAGGNRNDVAPGDAQGASEEAEVNGNISSTVQPTGVDGNQQVTAAAEDYRPMNSKTATLGINEPPVAGEGGSHQGPSRRGWIWLPLSFVFLLLGVFLGIQVSVSIGQKIPSALRPSDPLALGLTAAPAGQSVHLRWDRNSSIVKSAQRARLIITDGGAEKTVALTTDQLQFGSVIYHRGSAQIRFRFEVDVRERVTLIETLDFSAN